MRTWPLGILAIRMLAQLREGLPSVHPGQRADLLRADDVLRRVARRALAAHGEHERLRRVGSRGRRRTIRPWESDSH